MFFVWTLGIAAPAGSPEKYEKNQVRTGPLTDNQRLTMPGPYAHIALAALLYDNGRFGKAVRPPRHQPLSELFRFCLLGAVSPDYPNLAVEDAGAPRWADAMHYQRTGTMIQEGIRQLKQSRNTESFARRLAWFLGYCAHVISDATIHPVVRLKVGDYASNVLEHRICEMHQDVYVHELICPGRQIGHSPDFNTTLASCSHSSRDRRLHTDISRFWSDLLLECHLELYEENPPDIHGWHGNALRLIQAGSEDSRHIFPLARNILARNGLSYPAAGCPEPAYINGLIVPDGSRMDYGEVFARAMRNVEEGWSVIAGAIFDDDLAYLTWFGEWNLDTGCDPSGEQVFW